MTDAHSTKKGLPSGLHSVWYFNCPNKLECMYQNPTPPKKDGIVALWDASASMDDKVDESRVAASALKCMFNVQQSFNLPQPSGTTALVDAVDAIINKKLAGVESIFLVTDGEDTSSNTMNLIADIVDEEPKFVRLDSFGCTKQKADAVATHMNHKGINMFVVGIGNEVKHFIKALSNCERMSTAFLTKGASAEEVAAVVNEVSKRRPNGTKSKTIVAKPSPGQELEENTEAATPLSPSEMEPIVAEAAKTTTYTERKNNPALLQDGPPFDKDLQDDYVRFIVGSAASKIECKPDDLLAVVYWFRNLLNNNNGAPISGSLVGGQQWGIKPGETFNPKGAVFCPPAEVTKPYSWSSAIGRTIELLARDPDKVKDRCPGLFDKFEDAILQNKVGPIFREAGTHETTLLLSKEHLPVQLANHDLYYKFHNSDKGFQHKHYYLHHRASAYPFFATPTVMHLNVVKRGNASVPAGVSTSVSRDASPTEIADSSSDDGDVANDKEELNALKRKNESLQAENESLQAENVVLKRQNTQSASMLAEFVKTAETQTTAIKAMLGLE